MDSKTFPTTLADVDNDGDPARTDNCECLGGCQGDFGPCPGSGCFGNSDDEDPAKVINVYDKSFPTSGTDVCSDGDPTMSVDSKCKGGCQGDFGPCPGSGCVENNEDEEDSLDSKTFPTTMADVGSDGDHARSVVGKCLGGCQGDFGPCPRPGCDNNSDGP